MFLLGSCRTHLVSGARLTRRMKLKPHELLPGTIHVVLGLGEV